MDRTTPEATEDLATRFFDAMEREGLGSIQFKSTRTLANAFAGLEDFDLLIPPHQFEAALRIAEGLGFRLRRTTDPLHPAPVVDLLAWDTGTSRLHHLSLHRTLVFGERPVKRHVVPWNRIEVLATAEHRPGLHVLPAAAELTLLVARVLLRTSRPSRLRHPWRRVAVPVDTRMRAELADLDPLVQDDDLFAMTAHLLPGAEDVILRSRRRLCVDAASSPDDVRTNESDRRNLLRSLRPLATRSQLSGWLLEVRRRHRPVRHIGQGAVVAIVGADGAGKSTVTQAVVGRLGTKLTVDRAYLGLPRDDRTVARLTMLAAVARRMRLKRLEWTLAALRPIVVARLRRKRIRRAWDDASRGIITVTDRFPLREFDAVEPPMDGPRLTGPGTLARYERRIYAALPQEPDLIVALVGDAALLAARKPGDEEPTVLAEKADAVRRLAASRPDVLAVDAAAPLNTVVDRVITAVWNRIDAQPG